jgi:hypothetical protein
MAKPAAKALPSDKLALYEKLVATNPNVERKGDSVPYTSLNGHMFSYLSKRASWRFACRQRSGKRFSKSTKRNYARLTAGFNRSTWRFPIRCSAPRPS